MMRMTWSLLGGRRSGYTVVEYIGSFGADEMSFTYRVTRHEIVFMQPAGTHPGRAVCPSCHDRIPRDEPRIGWHGRFYHVNTCWWTRQHGERFLTRLLESLSTTNLIAAGLEVEPIVTLTPEDMTSDGWHTRVRVGDWIRRIPGCDNADYNSRNGLPVGEYCVTRTLDSTPYFFEIVRPNGTNYEPHLDSIRFLRRAENPEPATEIDGRTVREAGITLHQGDTVRFIRNMRGSRNERRPYLDTDLQVNNFEESSVRRDRMLVSILGVAENFYDDEVTLVRRARQ